MAKPRKILARRKAIDSIHTVTRTMEMVATMRFKRAYSRCTSARRYIDGTGELVEDILRRCSRRTLRHPLLKPLRAKPGQAGVRAVVVLTSDRGLCGGYNAAVLRLAEGHLDECERDGQKVVLHVAGKKGISKLLSAGWTKTETHATFDSGGRWRHTSHMAEQFMNEYYAERIDGVDVVCSRLIGSSRTAPVVFTLLPMELPTPLDETEDSWTMEERVPYEFVPSADIMMDRLLPMTIRLRLFQCFMEAAVTEHIARMTSMHSAGENAEDMIQNLTVKYNRTRQAQITTELAEILGGRTALE